MTTTAEREERLLLEFTALLDRSNVLFQSLRDVPQYGQKIWKPQFQIAFDCFTKLWKFQQTHRQLLESRLGLKRYEIGEIASRIAQLYYHYYLRTSDTNHLIDSFMFYNAVRERAYFEHVAEDNRLDLVIKKLRHYARGAVVCLLLRRDDHLPLWANDIRTAVEEYVALSKRLHASAPADVADWLGILKEMENFLGAENRVTVPDAVRQTFRMRLNETSGVDPSEHPGPRLVLQEAIIAVHRPSQIKFSELYIDMFRMLQALERDPLDNARDARARTTAMDAAAPTVSTVEATARDDFLAHIDLHDQEQATHGSKNSTRSDTYAVVGARTHARQPSNGGGATRMQDSHESLVGGRRSSNTSGGQEPDSNGAGDRNKPRNPHKYLLYRPSVQQLNVFAAMAVKELKSNAALLIYISGDAPAPDKSDNPSESSGYGHGGVMLRGDESPVIRVSEDPVDEVPPHASPNQLHPGDLIYLTRRPLVLIIDSPSSTSFERVSSPFGQPVLTLMSPVSIPSTVKIEAPRTGSLLTLFLYAPIKGVAAISGLADIPEDTYSKCDAHLHNFYAAVNDRFRSNKPGTAAWQMYLADDYLRLLIFRFIFCATVLRLSKAFGGKAAHQPACSPGLPGHILPHPSLQHYMLEVAAELNIRQQFSGS